MQAQHHAADLTPQNALAFQPFGDQRPEHNRIARAAILPRQSVTLPRPVLSMGHGCRETHEILDEQRTANPAMVQVRLLLWQRLAQVIHVLTVGIDHTNLRPFSNRGICQASLSGKQTSSASRIATKAPQLSLVSAFLARARPVFA